MYSSTVQYIRRRKPAAASHNIIKRESATVYHYNGRRE
jgi:hypothetical protein